jgi:hypothetical protein
MQDDNNISRNDTFVQLYFVYMGDFLGMEEVNNSGEVMDTETMDRGFNLLIL